MYIERDLSSFIQKGQATVQILTGPRQCGKSTLFSRLSGPSFREVSLDDLQLRTLANRDPGLFLEQFAPPVLIDEIQYAPNLFPEIKKIVDRMKRERIATGTSISPSFRLTGSNQLLLDKNVKESLAGRASWFYLNSLSVHEIKRAFPDIPIDEILFRGGWPELYTDPSLSPVTFLNDYLRSCVEKDIVLSAGILKQESFSRFLALLASRTGTLLEYSGFAGDCGIRSVTVKEWVGLLERSDFVHRLTPYFTNLTTRLTKTPKIYFLDSGLAVRLQGWREKMPLLMSPQAGPLFESLVFAEIVKYIRNRGRDWTVHFWRTREGEEIDFLIITASGAVVALDAKMSVQALQPFPLPRLFRTIFPATRQMVLVTYGGERLRLSQECLAVPVSGLVDFLEEIPE